MQVFPYLKMQGNAREAVHRYKQIFNGTIERFNEYKDSPLANQKNANQIIHCEVHFAGNIICLADMITTQEAKDTLLKPVSQSYELCINFQADKYPEAQRVFKELSQDGQVLMDLQGTFWYAYYGKVKDRFGIVWGLNCPYTEEEIMKAEQLKKLKKQRKESQLSSPEKKSP